MANETDFPHTKYVDPSWQPPSLKSDLPNFNREDAAVYIAELTSELEAIAKGAGHHMLAYVLSMAAREATLTVFRSQDFITPTPQ